MLRLPSHSRIFLQVVSIDDVRATNLNCSVIVGVRPTWTLLFNGYQLIVLGTHLTALASHIWARNAMAASAPSRDKLGLGKDPGTDIT